jgi:hypothetical protein
MMSQRFGNDPIDWLTEEARDKLIRELIRDHRRRRC